MKRFISLFFVLSAVVTSSQSQNLAHFKWLQGKWQLKGSGRFEKWTFENDSTANGLGYFVSDDGEVVPDEIIQLKIISGKIYYIPLLKEQNEAKQVVFTVVKHSPKSFTAENANHDYPQRIVYKLKSANKMTAYIEALNKTKRYVFRFEKVEL